MEDPVRQPVVAQELPDVFDRVQLGAFRRKWHERDVGRHDEMARQCHPAWSRRRTACLPGATRSRSRPGAGSSPRCRSGAGRARHPCRVRAYGPEDVGGGRALVVRGGWPRPASGPAPRDLVLLADPASSQNQGSNQLTVSWRSLPDGRETLFESQHRGALGTHHKKIGRVIAPNGEPSGTFWGPVWGPDQTNCQITKCLLNVF